MPGEYVALANIPSGLSAIGAEDGGRGCWLRISPLRGDAHRSDLKAGVWRAVGSAFPGYLVFGAREDKNLKELIMKITKAVFLGLVVLSLVL